MKIKKFTAALLAAALAVPAALPAAAMSQDDYLVKTSRMKLHDYTISDATTVQKVLADLASLSARQKSYFDVDFDGEISVTDATIIQQHCASVLDLHSDEYLSRFKPEQPSEPSTEAPLTIPFDTTAPSDTEPQTETTADVTEVWTDKPSKPAETTLEPATEPEETTLEPMTEPAETTLEPTTEPAETTLEPTAEPAETTLEPTTEPAETTLAPITEPAETTLEPITEPEETTVGVTEESTVKQATYLRLDDTNLKLGVNEIFTFSVETDAEIYSFRSFNDAVLKVDEGGTVTPVAPGNATVVCMSDNGISAVCYVQICPEATALTLNYGESLALGVGETVDFDSYVNAGAAAYLRYYTSDNEDVIRVERSGGIAAAVDEGSATVTCTLENGVKASCEVTVYKMPQGLELNASDVKLSAGDLFDFDSYAQGGYAHFRDYYSMDESIVSINRAGGVATAIKEGKTRIYCELRNGVRAWADVTVTAAPDSIEVVRSTDRLQVGETLRVTVKSGAGTVNHEFVTVTSSNGFVAVADRGADYIDLKGMRLGETDVTFETVSGLKETVRLCVEGSKALCIDISTWQGANVDFSKVRASGVDYVILRAGYGNEAFQIDNRFVSNYYKAKSAGLKVGVYWFSYATDALDAYNEAAACLSCIGGRQLDMPVYYDIEYEKALTTMSNDELTAMAMIFCGEIAKAGYRPGVYTSVTVYQNQIDYDLLVESGVSIWNAHWAPRCTLACDIWQYSEEGFIWGVDGYVDMNLIYNLYVVQQ